MPAWPVAQPATLYLACRVAGARSATLSSKVAVDRDRAPGHRSGFDPAPLRHPPLECDENRVVRVPGERYQEVLNELRRLGDVRTEQSTASDVTAEYTDLQSRLRNLQATAAQYLTLLQRAETINDILIVQDRLNVVRLEIEQVQGRIQLLTNQTDLATITVHLTPPALQPKPDENGGADSPLEVAKEAFEASLMVLLGIVTVGFAIVAFSWWLIPLAAAGAYLARRQMRLDRERRQAPPPAASAS